MTVKSAARDPLSPDQERTILSALGDIATDVSSGSDPNQAIVKAARHHQLPLGHVNLVVHAYNKGRTTQQLQEGSNLFDKSADFELADPEVILETIYPAKVKTAAQIEHETDVSADYLKPPTWLKKPEGLEKAAADVSLRLCEPPEPYPRDPTLAVKSACGTVEKYHRELENQRLDLSRSQESLFAGLAKLGTYFRTPGGEGFEDVRGMSIVLFGKPADAVMNQVKRTYPELQKQAARLPKMRRIDVDQAPYSTIRQCIDMAYDFVEKQAAFEFSTAELQKKACDQLRPFAHPRGQSLLACLSSGELEKSAEGIGDKVKTLAGWEAAKETVTGLASKLRGPEPEAAIQGHMNSLASPGHEGKLREIHAQAMLQDLMSNDPVISSHDPYEVTQAFNDIAQLAPTGSTQRLFMQAMLRKQLEQGHMDTFEVGEIPDTENRIRANVGGPQQPSMTRKAAAHV